MVARPRIPFRNHNSQKHAIFQKDNIVFTHIILFQKMRLQLHGKWCLCLCLFCARVVRLSCAGSHFFASQSRMTFICGKHKLPQAIFAIIIVIIVVVVDIGLARQNSGLDATGGEKHAKTRVFLATGRVFLKSHQEPATF